MPSNFSRTGQTIYAPGQSGNPPASVVQKGSAALVVGQQSYAIAFPVQFETVPTSFAAQVQMPNSNGEVFFASADLSTLTVSGVTVWLDGIPTAASTGGYINWRAEK